MWSHPGYGMNTTSTTAYAVGSSADVDFKANECVDIVWTDGRMYGATILCQRMPIYSGVYLIRWHRLPPNLDETMKEMEVNRTMFVKRPGPSAHAKPPVCVQSRRKCC